jgi:hypothetical protein
MCHYVSIIFNNQNATTIDSHYLHSQLQNSYNTNKKELLSKEATLSAYVAQVIKSLPS